jgi:hypothetical protein
MFISPTNRNFCIEPWCAENPRGLEKDFLAYWKRTYVPVGIKNVPMTFTFKIVAGSYEKLLYGLEGSFSAEGSDISFHLKPIFIFPAHASCIKAIAASPGGKWLATGSADEIIKVWDLRRRKEIGGLLHHEGPFCPQIGFTTRH